MSPRTLTWLSIPIGSLKRTAVLSLLTFGIAALLYLSGLLDSFELKAYDHMSRRLNPKSVSDRIVLVTIDQNSIAALAAQDIVWPWPRQVYAPLLEYLSTADAVFMDILFTENSSYGVADDRALSDAMRKTGNVYLPLFLTNAKESLGASELRLAEKAAVAAAPADAAYRSLIAPLEQFAAAAAGLGNVMIRPDEDGIYRRVPLLFRAGGYTLPHFALPYLLDRKIVTIRDNTLQTASGKIPLSSGTLLLRYSSHPAPFRTVSASDIIQSYLEAASGRTPLIDSASFKGKIVLVGLTAPGLYDLKPTAVTPVATGMHIHASTLENMLTENYLRALGTLPLFSFMFVICVMVTAAVLRYHSLLASTAVLCAAVFSSLALPAALFARGLYLQATAPFTAAIVSFAVAAAFSYAVEGKQRRFIKRTFDQYMDATLVQHVLDNPQLIRPGGQWKRVTVFFADIAGFTSLAEQLPPDESALILHDIFNAFTEVIIRNRGVIDKYIGDCVMAFWGAPVSTGHDESSACRAALDCMAALQALNAAFTARGLPPVSMRIGIHTGNAIVGNLGSDRLFDYTVVGDTVNLASRLESINKVFKTKIIVSGETAAAATDQFIMRDLGRVAVKGKSEAVAIRELVGHHDSTPHGVRETIARFHVGLEQYRGQRWQEAVATFKQILALSPDDGPALFYLRRCESPGTPASLTADCDIITMTEK